ncbi:hypothetical protein JL720_13732 [Aureococcus anophagefferens]|nr:hypothetical protein JL720_13732 [Aureococcus anophagefferens]
MDAKVALWREVEAGTRYTVQTAMERHPQLKKSSCNGLRSELACKPKQSDSVFSRARDVKTYLVSDVDALAARLAAAEPEPVDPRWLEVEAGTRYTAKTAMEQYPQLSVHSCIGLPFEIARRPKMPKAPYACDVKTYAAADVDALVARLAKPVDPRWLEVESGARYTQKTAMERYPQLNFHSFEDLTSGVATKPKSKNNATRDVKTYLAADVDALAARLAAPEPVDSRWLEVEAGARYTQKTAMERYPHLSYFHFNFADLPFEIAQQPKQKDIAKSRACDVMTYLAADVDALVARLAAPDTEPVDPRWLEASGKGGGARNVKTYAAADVDALVAPEPVDPRWLEVEAGRRYSRVTAKKRYPQLTIYSFADLPFQIARRPKSGKAPPYDVFTYAAADIEKLAASRAKKRARVQEPEPPQEPEPEQEEPEECPICLDPLTGATATLVCGHLFCKDCIADWARSQTTCPTCRATLQIV